MTKKERVVNALNHKESDIIPYHADFTEHEYSKIVKYTNDTRFMDKLGLHLHYTQYWGWPTEAPDRPGFFRDAFNVTWNRTGPDKDIGVIDAPIIGKPDISLWYEPELDAERYRAELQETINSSESKFTFPGIGFSMFERAWSMCGMENLLIYMIEEPDFVHELLDRICEYNLKVIDIANEYPFDGFYIGDDWGQQKGLIMGPKLWREFIKPRIKRMYERARVNGKFVIQHSCGDNYTLFPDLIEIGMNCYQTFQPEIYDIEKVKREFGKDLTFWGGISTQQLLPKAAPDEIIRETIRIMNIMGQGGGYIAAPTHAVPGDVPPESIFAMFDVFMNQNKYL